MIVLLLGMTLAVTGAEAKSEAPDDAALAAKVAALVQKLDAAQLAERNDAERALVELGPRVLPYLPSIAERTAPETATRVARIQQRLLREQAAAAAQPTQVTLKGQDMPLSEILAAITKQTGNPIADHRKTFGEEAEDVKLSVDFDKTPFWRAVDQILDKADLTLYPFTGERGLFVISRTPGAVPRGDKASYAGLFRLEPLRFEAMHDLRDENMSSLKFYMDVSWEPRLQPFAILQPLATVSAVANTGEPIAVGSAEAEPEAMIREGMSTVELEVPLAMPSRRVEKISTLKGKLQALVPGPFEDFRFSNLPVVTKNAPAKRVELRKAGTVVSIDQVRKNNENWEVSLRVKFEGSPSTALESHRAWVLDNQAFFLDSEGQRVEAGGMEQTLQNRDEIGVNYYFELKDDPRKLTFVYRTPITVLEISVDYEFKDLPLP